MKEWTTRGALLLPLSIWCLPVVSAVPQYTVTPLGTLGGQYTVPCAISDTGYVAGYAATPDESEHAVLWYQGQLLDLGSQLGDRSYALDVNDAGVVTGWTASREHPIAQTFVYSSGAGMGLIGEWQARALNNAGQIVGTGPSVWTSGQLTLLGTLGGAASGAQDINASGQIVGYSETMEEGIWHATLWDAGSTRDLGTLGGASSEAFGISNAGWVVGQSDTAENELHAFLWRDGTMQDLGVKGFAQAVNDAGQIVGSAFGPATYPHHPFLWDNGILYDLNNLLAGTGYLLTDVADINNAGQIVATGMFNGEWRGLLLTPTPEPGTGLLLLGGACLARCVRRREPNSRGGHEHAREEVRAALPSADAQRKLPPRVLYAALISLFAISSDAPGVLVYVQPGATLATSSQVTVTGTNVTILEPLGVGMYYSISSGGNPPEDLGTISSSLFGYLRGTRVQIYGTAQSHQVYGARNITSVRLSDSKPTTLMDSHVSGNWGTPASYTGADVIQYLYIEGKLQGTVDASSNDFAMGGIVAGEIGSQSPPSTATIRAHAGIGGIQSKSGIAAHIVAYDKPIATIRSGYPGVGQPAHISGTITAGSITNRLSTEPGTGGNLTATVNVADTIGNIYIDGVTSADITAGTIYIGNNGPYSNFAGNVNSTGGTVTIGAHLYVGQNNAGCYTLYGGTLTGTGALTVGPMGDLCGRGSVGLTGSLTNNGKITADGNDADAVLSFASCSNVLNSVDNTDGYGWFAVNQGKLTLPDLTIGTSNATYNWGEPSDDTDIDLVNSLRFETTDGVTTGGALRVSLLDKERSETPVVALYAADYPALGIWEFAAPNRFAKANVTVRYDHASTGMTPGWRPAGTESTLVLGRAYLDGETWWWRVVNWAPQIDTQKHQLLQDGVESSSDGATYLAVVQGYVGDMDLSGCVDAVDLLILVDAFGTDRDYPENNEPGKVYDAAADLNADAYVDVVDLLMLVDVWALDQYGTECSEDPAPETEGLVGVEDEGSTLQSRRRASLYQALDQVGLLEFWVDYVSDHPEADL